MSSKKKILIGASVIIIGVGVLFLIYWVFFRSATPTANKNEEININALINALLPNTNAANLNANAAVINLNAALPEIAAGGATQAIELVPEAIKESTIGSNGQDVVYYDQEADKFYKISPDGRTKTLLSNDTFPQVDEIFWSPDKTKAIMSFPDNSKIIYDFSKQEQHTLAKEMEDFSFGPNSDQIAFKFIGSSEDDQWLAVAKADGSEVNIIEPLGDQANFVTPNWTSSGQIIATYAKSSSANQQEIILLGQYDENFKSIMVDGYGFEGDFSPDSTRLLYSVYNSLTAYDPELYVVDAQGDAIGQNKIDLGVATWPSKCDFSSAGVYAYCAVPRYLPTGSGLYPELANDVPDDFYRINLNTGGKELLAVPVDENGLSNFNGRRVYLSDDEQYLYFEDRATGKIMKIRLK
jgi:Tol biopolymer transport system component